MKEEKEKSRRSERRRWNVAPPQPASRCTRSKRERERGEIVIVVVGVSVHVAVAAVATYLFGNPG